MDIVDELFDSDAASALTNRAAREIARLRDLIEVLRGGRQCDEDGTEIIMSRQACHEAAEEITRLRDENESLRGSLEEWKLDLNSLRDENAKLRVELGEVASALPGPHYMDLPDGGSVTIAEQVGRMAKDAAKWREREAKIASLKARGFLGSPLRDAAMRKGE